MSYNRIKRPEDPINGVPRKLLVIVDTRHLDSVRIYSGPQRSHI